jgi:hypothetical protein
MLQHVTQKMGEGLISCVVSWIFGATVRKMIPTQAFLGAIMDLRLG